MGHEGIHLVQRPTRRGERFGNHRRNPPQCERQHLRSVHVEIQWTSQRPVGGATPLEAAWRGPITKAAVRLDQKFPSGSVRPQNERHVGRVRIAFQGGRGTGVSEKENRGPILGRASPAHRVACQQQDPARSGGENSRASPKSIPITGTSQRHVEGRTRVGKPKPVLQDAGRCGEIVIMRL